MHYVFNGFYVLDFIALCWATFSALRALLSSHIMTNKDDDDDDKFNDFHNIFFTYHMLKLVCFS